ncbi:MAG: nucleoside-diphosphate sugar epimerase, partial [Proteobacteria bacterium]
TRRAFAGERRRLRASRSVRSIQRLPLPAGRDAAWVAREYAAWLPRLLWPLVRVEVDADGSCSFSARPLARELLHLRLEPARSSGERRVFAIDRGALVDGRAPREGRLEFREVLGGRCVLAAVHDFRPALPWPLYAVTQARVHAWVMRRFGRHLAACGA